MVQSYLSGIFGASPIRPLTEHMNKVMDCTERLLPFVDAALSDDAEGRVREREGIIKLENDADELKKDLRLHLPKSLFMPVDRRDLLDMLTMQDKVAGAVRDVAGLIVGRQMHFPEAMRDPYRKLVVRCIDACRKAQQAIQELDELLETGFGGKVIDEVTELLEQLDDIEQDTDDRQAGINAILFGLEQELPALEVMFLYRVIDKTGAVADRAQRVGSRLQLMLAR